MKRWGIVITGFYVLAVLTLFGPVLRAVAFGEFDWEFGGLPTDWSDPLVPLWWSWVLLLVGGQALLLFLAVDTRWRKLKARQSVRLTALCVGLALALLTSGVVLSLLVAPWGDSAELAMYVPLAVPALWLAWGLVFARYCRGVEDAFSRAVDWLLRGSVLELLVAVPAHVVVRQREDCSAPTATSWGIVTGIAIMLSCFGPGVLLLYRKRLEAYAAPVAHAQDHALLPGNWRQRAGVLTGVVMLTVAAVFLPVLPVREQERGETVQAAGKRSEAEVAAARRDAVALIGEMVTVPAGHFVMGSDVEGGRAAPRHPVSIARPFAFGKTEVTFAAYDAFAVASGRRLPEDNGFGRGDRPVINVSWNDAAAYAEWLATETGKRFRLPTEAEWEYAARAGSISRYSWGDEIGVGNVNCRGCGGSWDDKGTAPVGAFAPNAFGLYDMLGNVHEWVDDCWHDDYTGAPDDGTAWKKAGYCEARVMRGGSWNHEAHEQRCSNRFVGYKNNESNEVGIRLALDLE